ARSAPRMTFCSSFAGSLSRKRWSSSRPFTWTRPSATRCGPGNWPVDRLRRRSGDRRLRLELGAQDRELRTAVEDQDPLVAGGLLEHGVKRRLLLELQELVGAKDEQVRGPQRHHAHGFEDGGEELELHHAPPWVEYSSRTISRYCRRPTSEGPEMICSVRPWYCTRIAASISVR